MQNKEIIYFSNLICRNISKNGQLNAVHEEMIENAVMYSLDEVIFTICKVLIELGHTKQEANNRLALQILGDSLIETIPFIEKESGEFKNLFYSWINSQDSQGT